MNAVATYDATGSFTGIQVSSLQINVALAASGQYAFKAKVSSNTGVAREDEAGTFSVGDQSIMLNGTTNPASKYRGDQWLLFRAP